MAKKDAGFAQRFTRAAALHSSHSALAHTHTAATVGQRPQRGARDGARAARACRWMPALALAPRAALADVGTRRRAIRGAAP